MAAAAAQVEWAYLRAELLGTISGRLQNPSEIVRFRSVCRSWRSSTPLPPNKLSALFPRIAPFFYGSYPSYDRMVKASAVYLVRPRSDPSKAWLVSIEESDNAGNLVLRQALSYREINGNVGLDLEADWIVATQTPIAMFYTRNAFCRRCNGVRSTIKEVFVRESYGQLVGLCDYPHVWVCNVLAFRLGLGGGGRPPFDASQVTRSGLPPHRRPIDDFVKFKGRIFAVDYVGHIGVLDHTNLQLVQMTWKPVRRYIGGCTWFRFVVSDGDLYVVWISYDELWYPDACEIYRLKVNNTCDGGCSSEEVEDLGDRVFFITRNCSFSISARLLPLPWRQGNCVFVPNFPSPGCRCVGDDIKYEHAVFHLGSRTFTELSDPEGHSYTDLFSPPA